MKWFREHLEFFVIAVLFTGIFFYALTNASAKSSSTSLAYANNFFDDTRVHDIDISISSTDLYLLREFPEDKTKFLVSAKLDGVEIKNVSFSTHGNASLANAADDKNTDRYPYKIKFDRYDDTNLFFGLDELVLNPAPLDESFMHDYFSYKIMSKAGVDTPLASFTRVSINGVLSGLYLAIEDLDDSFLARTGSSNSALFKPESPFHNRSMVREMEAYLAEGEPFPDDKFDYLGADLVYRDDNPESYEAIFEHSVKKLSPEIRDYTIEALRVLNEEPENIENYWDMDEIAKYFAAHAFTINNDSYAGSIAHNYFLRLDETNKFEMLPWDYNAAFAQYWLEGDDKLFENYTRWPIDSLLHPNIDINERPLFRVLISNDVFKEKYHVAIQELLDNYFNKNQIIEEVDRVYEMIRPELTRDPSKPYTVEEYDIGVENLKNFLYVRSDSIQKQLLGVQPKTYEGYKNYK